MLKIIDIYNMHESLFYDASVSLNFLSESDRRSIDTIIKNEFTSYEIFSHLQDYETLVDYLTVFASSMAYKWDNLIKTTKLDYNPIWNVDGTEIRKRSAVDNYTQESGTTNVTEDIGERTNTSTIGERINKSTPGKVTQLTENAVVNSDKLKTANKVTTENTSQTVDTLGQGIDTIKSNPATDTKEIQHGKKTSESFNEEFTRTGNIGVTSTQSLIAQQRRIVDFNILRTIAHDVAYVICMP